MFGFGGQEPVTACSLVEFNSYAATSISRIACPPNASALDLPPEPPRITIPEGTDTILEEALPARPAATHVRRQVADRMPAPPKDGVTGLQDLRPAVEVVVADGDVGVSLWEPSSSACLLGARLNGDVLVWRPSRMQMEQVN
jgi:hypothetical protein